MRVVIQRVVHASVTIDEKVTGEIKSGLLILAGIEEADTEDDLKWLSGKIVPAE
jgi:D-tyrosyl-tRNA(Tyr) deacylase